MLRKNVIAHKRNSIVQRSSLLEKKPKKAPVKANKKPKEKESGVKAAQMMSRCGQYQTSATNNAYFIDITAVDLIKQSQNEIFITLEDFQNKIIK
jgi:hypothetical protein